MKKRVGIILDSTSISKQLADLISLSKKSENYEITALVINNFERNKRNIGLQIAYYIKRRGLEKFLSNAVFRVVCKMESIVLKRMSKFNKFYSISKLNKEDFVSISVSPQISKSGLVYRYSPDDIENIRKLNLDF